MNIHHKARIVEELQSRLAEAMNDEDADLLATQLAEAGDDLEAACAIVLRECRARKAEGDGLDPLLDEIKSRQERHYAFDKKGRALVADALSNAGLPGFKTADMTVSFRWSKAPLIIDGEPDQQYATDNLVTAKTIYSWNKQAIMTALDEGAKLSFARFGNPCPQIVVRGK